MMKLEILPFRNLNIKMALVREIIKIVLSQHCMSRVRFLRLLRLLLGWILAKLSPHKVIMIETP